MFGDMMIHLFTVTGTWWLCTHGTISSRVPIAGDRGEGEVLIFLLALRSQFCLSYPLPVSPPVATIYHEGGAGIRGGILL